VGWFAYYYILAKTSITSVSLVPLIVPLFAVWIGIAFNDETLSYSQSLASITILAGLGMFIAAKRQPNACRTTENNEVTGDAASPIKGASAR
jgi:drug/metabolite transporter (DMT)-like permease